MGTPAAAARRCSMVAPLSAVSRSNADAPPDSSANCTRYCRPMTPTGGRTRAGVRIDRHADRSPRSMQRWRATRLEPVQFSPDHAGEARPGPGLEPLLERIRTQPDAESAGARLRVPGEAGAIRSCRRSQQFRREVAHVGWGNAPGRHVASQPAQDVGALRLPDRTGRHSARTRARAPEHCRPLTRFGTVAPGWYPNVVTGKACCTATDGPNRVDETLPRLSAAARASGRRRGEVAIRSPPATTVSVVAGPDARRSRSASGLLHRVEPLLHPPAGRRPAPGPRATRPTRRAGRAARATVYTSMSIQRARKMASGL